jgi:hypothetical protein
LAIGVRLRFGGHGRVPCLVAGVELARRSDLSILLWGGWFGDRRYKAAKWLKGWREFRC